MFSSTDRGIEVSVLLTIMKWKWKGWTEASLGSPPLTDIQRTLTIDVFDTNTSIEHITKYYLIFYSDII